MKDANADPVAWLHDGEGRFEVIHADIKRLWMKVNPKQVEHYTIPLYAAKDANQ